jgi:hypothetical protein
MASLASTDLSAPPQVPKQLHITPLKPDPYPAYLRGPVLNVKDACHYVLSDLWYTSELEKSAVLEAKYRATLEETRRKADEARLKTGSLGTGVQKPVLARPPFVLDWIMGAFPQGNENAEISTDHYWPVGCIRLGRVSGSTAFRYRCEWNTDYCDRKWFLCLNSED